MSLKTVIAADATAVFLDSVDGFAESATQRKRGDPSDTATVTVIVDRDRALDRDSGPGAANDRFGERVNQTVLLEVPTATATHPDDVWVLADGTLLNFVSETSRDDALKTLLCRAPKGITTRQPRIR